MQLLKLFDLLIVDILLYCGADTSLHSRKGHIAFVEIDGNIFPCPQSHIS